MDITMCYGKRNKHICLLREDCLRYKGNVNELYQSYFKQSPFVIKLDGFKCDYQLKLNK